MRLSKIYTIIFMALIPTSVFAGNGMIIIDHGFVIPDKSKARYFELYESSDQKQPSSKCKIKMWFFHDAPIDNYGKRTTKENVFACMVTNPFDTFRIDSDTWALRYSQSENGLFKVKLLTTKEEYAWIKLPDKQYKFIDHDENRMQNANAFSETWDGLIYLLPNGKSFTLASRDDMQSNPNIWIKYRFYKSDKRVIDGVTWIEFNRIQYMGEECSPAEELLKGEVFWVRAKDENGNWNINSYEDGYGNCS